MKSALLLLILSISLNISQAQTKVDAAQYLIAITNAQNEMKVMCLKYLGTAGHQLNERNVEMLRRQVLESITNAQIKTTAIPAYAGDNELRQQSIDYIQMCYNIFNNDLGKINLKEIEEQPFDAMQGTILVQEKATDKLVEASLVMKNATRDFAKKHNLEFTSQADSFTAKLAQASRLNKYRNEVFLIFYKCKVEDNRITKAIEAKNVNDIENGRNTLLQYAITGLTQLDSIKNYEGDPSLKHACKEPLEFYKNIAQYDIPQLTEFYLAEENFNKIKKEFDKTSKHSKEQIYTHNAKIKNHNAAVTRYHQVNNFIINSRKLILSNWNARQKIFGDTHRPHD